jgi:hypothetical protein
MRGRAAAVALLLAAGLGARGVAQVASAGDALASKRMTMPSVSFRFELAGERVPKFTVTIFSDATGTYEGEEAIGGARPEGDTPVPPQLFHRELTVSPALAKRIFLLAGQLKHFKMECESKAKNMAATGMKTLTYRAPDDEGSCVYNFSDDEKVHELTMTFRGLAETMDVGRRLDFLRRFDRLGLDAELELLSNELGDGRAREPGMIAPSLRAIAGDADVMQRARTKAGALLATIPEGAAESVPAQR